MTAFLLDDIRNGNAAADRLLTHLAAGGDLTAQRDLLTLLIGDPERPELRQINELTFEEAVRAELLARFCALRGHGLDARRLAAVLLRMAEAAPSGVDRAAFASEALGLLSALADEGDGVASDHLPKLVSLFPEVRAELEVSDVAAPAADPPPAPPPIIATNVTGEVTLGDLLAAVLSSDVVQNPPPPPSFLERVRNWVSKRAAQLRLIGAR